MILVVGGVFLRLLLVEDDKDLCDVVSMQLEHQGYSVDVCISGEEALLYISNYDYHVVLLDRMLPVIDGLSIAEIVRKKKINTPIIMVTAMGDINSRVEGLDSGADDYLVKPFAIEELLARIRALVRRPPQIEDIEKIEFSDIVMDQTNKLITKGDKTIHLSKREADLLAYLIRNRKSPVPRERILAHVWGVDTTVEMSNLDNYICFLRRRLKNIESKLIIKTIYGVGYKLEES